MKVKYNNPGDGLLLQVYAVLLFITSVLSSPIVIANSDLSSIAPVIAEFENNVGKRNVYIPVNSTSKYTTVTMDTVSKLPLGSMIDPETLSKILAENEINAPVNVSRREAVAAGVRTIESATYSQIMDTIPGVSKREVVATDRTIESAVSAEIMATLSRIPLGGTVDSDIMSKIAADIVADIAADVSKPHSLQKRNTTTAQSEAAALSDLDQTFSHLPLGSLVDSNIVDKLLSELGNLNTTSGVDTDASPSISSAAEDANALMPRDSTCLLGVCGNKGSLCRKHDVPCTIDVKTETVNCPTCQCTKAGAGSSPVCIPSLRLFNHLFFIPLAESTASAAAVCHEWREPC